MGWTDFANAFGGSHGDVEVGLDLRMDGRSGGGERVLDECGGIDDGARWYGRCEDESFEMLDVAGSHKARASRHTLGHRKWLGNIRERRLREMGSHKHVLV